MLTLLIGMPEPQAHPTDLACAGLGSATTLLRTSKRRWAEDLIDKIGQALRRDINCLFARCIQLPTSLDLPQAACSATRSLITMLAVGLPEYISVPRAAHRRSQPSMVMVG